MEYLYLLATDVRVDSPSIEPSFQKKLLQNFDYDGILIIGLLHRNPQESK